MSLEGEKQPETCDPLYFEPDPSKDFANPQNAPPQKAPEETFGPLSNCYNLDPEKDFSDNDEQ